MAGQGDQHNLVSVLLDKTTVAISLEIPCVNDSCRAHAEPLYALLNVPHYSRGASLLPCPGRVSEWRSEHRTARKRAMRAERLGYTFAEVDYSRHDDDIHAINTSLQSRQGRPMSASYRVRRQHGRLSDAQTRCPRHRTHTYGVLQGETLVAYLTLHRAGELAMVSMILGHGAHRDNGIMFLLIQGVIEAQAPQTGFYYYNLHSSGQDGLRWNKERLGFAPADIEWSLS